MTHHFKKRFHWLHQLYLSKEVSYDQIYNFVEGWLAYAKHADTYSLRQKVMAELEQNFSSEISAKEVNRYFIAYTFPNPPLSDSSYPKTLAERMTCPSRSLTRRSVNH